MNLRHRELRWNSDLAAYELRCRHCGEYWPLEDRDSWRPWVSLARCVACYHEMARGKSKAYRATHPRRREDPEYRREWQRLWREQNRERRSAYQRAYYQRHREAALAYAKARYAAMTPAQRAVKQQRRKTAVHQAMRTQPCAA